MSVKLCAFLAGTAMSGLLISSPAMAQEAAASGAGEAQSSTGVGSEIIVTAQRREQRLQDVPIAVSVLSEEALAERGINSLGDVAGQVAGMSFGTVAGAGNITVRGIGTAIESGSGEGSVAVHLDGIFLGQVKAYPMSAMDLGSVEVLKGPQSTLYGRNSVAGVINMISAKPTSTLSIGGMVGYGNYSHLRGNLHLSGPLGDNVRVRAFVEGEQHDGYVKNPLTGKGIDDLRAYGTRLSVDADITSNWTAEIRWTHRREESVPFTPDSYDPTFAFGPGTNDFRPYYVATSAEGQSGTRNFDLVSVRNIINVGDATLVSLTGFGGIDALAAFDNFGIPGMPVVIESDTKQEQISQEFNLNGTNGGVDWLAGLFFFQNKQDILGRGCFTAVGLPFCANQEGNSTQTSFSAFGDVTVAVSDRARIFGGARYLWDKSSQELTVFNTTPDGTLINFDCTPETVPQKRDRAAITGRIGFQYDVMRDGMIYGQYSRGYKAPGYSQSTCDNPFDAETIDAFEIGLKSSLANGAVTLNASAFFYLDHDLQFEAAVPTGVVVQNFPESRSYGVEVDLTVEPVENLRFNFAGLYVKAEYLELTNLDPLNGYPFGADLRGEPLNQSPEFSANIGAEYEVPLGDAGSLTLRGESYLTTEYKLREVPTDWATQKGYVTGNLYAIYRSADEAYYLRGFVKNIANEAVLGGVYAYLGALGVYQPPRTYGVEVGFDF